MGGRGCAGSIRAIMSSRHANTGRKGREGVEKRGLVRKGDRGKGKGGFRVPWIGEMIVVKVYDQMDSLRDVLEQPARIHFQEEAEVVEEIPCGEMGIERTRKRKREEEAEEQREDAVEKERMGEELTCDQEAEGGRMKTSVEVLIPTKKVNTHGTVFTIRNSSFQPLRFCCGHPLIDP
jgi:hypothetical protein